MMQVAYMSLRVAILLSLPLSGAGQGVGQDGTQMQGSKPVTHDPNDFDLEGNPCSLRLPPQRAYCPAFVVNCARSSGFFCTQDEMENECLRLGVALAQQCLKRGQHILPDGTCGDCENNTNLTTNSESGEIYCATSSGKKDQAATDKLPPSPSACIGVVGVSTYRVCSEDLGVSVTIPNFYKGHDIYGELTMTECAIEFGYPHIKTQIPDRTFNFPLVHLRDDYTQRFGFLKCPYKYEEEYDFFTPGWWVCYGTYITGFSILLAYCIYKIVVEKKAYAASGRKMSKKKKKKKKKSTLR
eukprot:Selendium_serpulae@DN4299_c0_g1_i3.p1